jgi:hypothetical protein
MTDVKRLSPPYTSYASTRTLFGSLHDNGTPSRIDRSVMKSFSNAVGTQLITGLKFLKLINEEQRPSEAFLELIDSYGTDDWKKRLLDVLNGAYPELFSLGLEVVSPAEFSEAFRRAYGVEGDVLRKCMTFFINAVQDTAFPISKYLLAGKKPRGPGAAKKRAPKPAMPKTKTSSGVETDNSAHIPVGRVLKPSEILLNYLKDMGPQEQEAAWVLMKHFAAKNL